MSEMTNAEITAEFEALFGGAAVDDQPAPEDVEEPETPEEEAPEEESVDEEQAEDESQDESDSQEETQPAPTPQSRQNHAFAEQRVQIKKQNDFIRNIGRLIGFDENAKLEDIQQKVAEVLLEKQSKEQGIPVEILQRLERAESLIQENEQIKLEKKVSEDFADLIDEHSLTDSDVEEFTQFLIENGKNPMIDRNVDIKAEYPKLHMSDIISKAVDAALKKENDRKQKVDEHSPSETPKSPGAKDEATITSVKELDDLFDGMSL